MTRTIALATAAALCAGPVLAEAHVMSLEGMITAEQIEDGRVYALDGAYDEETWMGEEAYAFDPNYEDVGEIEDVVLDARGQMVGVTAEVGGFLGIGDHLVMLPIDEIRLVPVDDAEFAYVTRLTEDQLEELPVIEGDLLGD